MFLSYASITLSLVFTGTLGKGWADYSAHHAARLTYAHLPILVGLASKDLGVISWLTGFSCASFPFPLFFFTFPPILATHAFPRRPATLNAFHRWMARMTFFLAVWVRLPCPPLTHPLLTTPSFLTLVHSTSSAAATSTFRVRLPPSQYRPLPPDPPLLQTSTLHDPGLDTKRTAPSLCQCGPSWVRTSRLSVCAA